MSLSFEDLKAQTASGEVDTVLACLVDMQGRLMGLKRFHAGHFVAGICSLGRDALLQLPAGD